MPYKNEGTYGTDSISKTIDSIRNKMESLSDEAREHLGKKKLQKATIATKLDCCKMINALYGLFYFSNTVLPID